jgi:hypothetical protein
MADISVTECRSVAFLQTPRASHWIVIPVIYTEDRYKLALSQAHD